MIRFPYGISDFYQIINEGYFYVDRTASIRLIEDAGKQLLFVRPRRFGKSLLLSMLESYYDVARADEFERLFGHLAIGRNPTPLHNRYLVMKWDFSNVAAYGDVEHIEQSLHDHINGRIKQFVMRYQDRLDYEVELSPSNALLSFQSLLAVIQQTPYRLYLLIDEYDNFANEVMMSSRPDGRRRYEELLYGEGLFKTIFKAIKSASAGQGLDRVFITGVSPIVLSDVTSGYNVAKNIYLEPKFNDLCGFWEAEIASVLQQIAEECNYPPEKTAEALSMMRIFYNGYAFTYDAEGLVYNPTLALYFMDYFQRYCQSPPNMLDSNFAMDRAKIAYIARMPGGESLILDALQEETPVSVPQLADRFGLTEMLSETHDTVFMASLLYYLGVLTLTGERTPFGELILRIPNLVIRKLYAERLREMLLPDGRNQDAGRQAAQALYQTGDMQPLCDFIEQHYFKILDNRDYRWANEMTVKTAFLTLLFNDAFYIVDSEPALERSYADFTMIVRPEMRRYQLLDILIEFKYLKLGDTGLSANEVRRLSRAELKDLPAVQRQLSEARTKLRDYRIALEEKYKGSLRLRTYTVVALGFERLVWEEVQ